jgi:hypothetical protein
MGYGNDVAMLSREGVRKKLSAQRRDLFRQAQKEEELLCARLEALPAAATSISCAQVEEARAALRK